MELSLIKDVSSSAHDRRRDMLRPCGILRIVTSCSHLRLFIETGNDMAGLYWEEWEVGAEFTTAARTVTETDIVVYAGLSGDYNPLHVNEEYSKTTEFGGRIAHGPLVYGIAAGLLFQL